MQYEKFFVFYHRVIIPKLRARGLYFQPKMYFIIDFEIRKGSRKFHGNFPYVSGLFISNEF